MAVLVSYDTTMLLATSSSAIAVWATITILRRLYWSPLARIPGPKLAALASWYEIYYDVFRKDTYVWKIKGMHDRYGTIVRIHPWEVHISDPAFYDDIYTTSASKRDKDPAFTHSVNTNTGGEAAFWNALHSLHLIRRGALKPYFGKRKIAHAQDVVQSEALHLCERLKAFAEAGQVVHLRDTLFATIPESV